MQRVQAEIFQNPQLEGESFYWEGGPVGVLLCHGFRATTAEVRPLARFLHEQGYTVSGPLLPGHGTTPQELNRCRWREWVAAVERASAELAARTEVLFVGGESMGSLLALYLASEEPEIAGVMAYAPALLLKSREVRFLAPLLAPFVPTLPRREGTPTASDALWKGYLEYPVSAAREFFRLQRAVKARLSPIFQPLLVMQGERDPLVDPRAPDRLFHGVSSAWRELHRLSRSPHCLLLDEERDRASALTLRFIEGVLALR